MAMGRAAAAAAFPRAAAAVFSRPTCLHQTRTIYSPFFFEPYFHYGRGHYPEPPDLHRLSLPTNFGVKLVPSQTVYIVERCNKYHKTLHSGLHFLIPFIDKITHAHSLHEKMIFPRDLPFRTSNDSVFVTLGYVLHLKIVDPLLASYGVDHPLLAARNVVEDKMVSEILSRSSITLDKLLEQKTSLCEIVMREANADIATWGVKCVRSHLGFVSICPEVSPTERKTLRLLRIVKI